MSNTKTKTPKVMTPEEKEQQVARFLGQKKETFTMSIISSLCYGKAHRMTEEAGCKVVDIALAMADHLMGKLYSVED